MIKILSINKQTATAEVEVPLSFLLPQHEVNRKAPLTRLLDNPVKRGELKRLEALGDAPRLARFIQKNAVVYHD